MADIIVQEPEMTGQQRFDKSCKTFTDRMKTVAAWKHNYYGAAYTTRLKQAIREARDACDTLEIALKQMGEI